MIVVLLVVGVVVAMSVAGWVLLVRDALTVDLGPSAPARVETVVGGDETVAEALAV